MKITRNGSIIEITTKKGVEYMIEPNDERNGYYVRIWSGDEFGDGDWEVIDEVKSSQTAIDQVKKWDRR